MARQPAQIPTVINKTRDLKAFLRSVQTSRFFYVALQGQKLGQHGTLASITILAPPFKDAHLIDIIALGSRAFRTNYFGGYTLKMLLEISVIRKCFWDMRNGAEALYALFNIKLLGVMDLQFLENACCRGNNTLLKTLNRAVEGGLKLEGVELQNWLATNALGKAQADKDFYTARPIAKNTVQSCLNDVKYLPILHQNYLESLSPLWLSHAMRAGAKRLDLAKWGLNEPDNSVKKMWGPWPIHKEKEFRLVGPGLATIPE